MTNPVVLVIDDDQQIRESIEAALTTQANSDYDVVCACDGHQGLELFHRYQPSIILLDLHMPKMDGLEVLEKLQLQPDDPFFVIALASEVEDQYIQDCYEMGVYSFVRKPFNVFELQGLVKQGLRMLEVQKQLQLANQTKTDFLSRMSHEFKTPLNAILGFAQLLQLTIDDKAKQNVRHIENAGHQLLLLVNNMLSLSNLKWSNFAVELADFELDLVLQKSIRKVEKQAQNAAIKLDCHDNTGLVIRANAEQLTQVLINLLSNGIKFSDNSDKVELRVVASTKEVEIAVIDYGIGLKADELDRIFEPFYRSEYAEKHAIDGMGIGLTLAKKMVRQMKGQIGVDSSWQQGCRFWLRLPLAEIS